MIFVLSIFEWPFYTGFTVVNYQIVNNPQRIPFIVFPYQNSHVLVRKITRKKILFTFFSYQNMFRCVIKTSQCFHHQFVLMFFFFESN